MSIIARNFEPKTKPNGDQTVGTATLCPICKHNNKDCNYGDIACDAVMALDTSVEESEAWQMPSENDFGL
jgi:hypothetical protein